MKIYYIRHGDPIYNPDSLTEKGIEQAIKTAKFFDSIKLDKIFASTSNRAFLTANETAVRQNKDVIRLSFADEQYAWKHIARFDAENNITTWVYRINKYKKDFYNPEVLSLGKKWFTHPLFNNDNFELAFNFYEENITKWLDSIGIERDANTGECHLKESHLENVALFAHGGFGSIFLSYILNIPYNISCLAFHELSTCGIVELEINENDTAIICNFFNKTVY